MSDDLPMFVIDKASCLCYMEKTKGKELEVIQKLQVESATAKLDRGIKTLMITDSQANLLTEKYKNTDNSYRADALVEASEHKAIPASTDEAEELVRLASLHVFEKHTPVHIVVKDEAVYKRLKADQACPFEVFKLSEEDKIMAMFPSLPSKHKHKTFRSVDG